MNDLSRRAAIAGATGVGLSALLSSPEGVQGAEPAQTGEFLVIGPFNLGDWLKKSNLQFDSVVVKLGAPAREAMVKSFRECWVYVIDQRVRSKDNSLRFAKSDYPRVALTGPLYHEWKHEKKQLIVQIASLLPHTMSTKHSKPTPTREFTVTIQLRTAEETEDAKSSSTTNFTVDPIKYDINGLSC